MSDIIDPTIFLTGPDAVIRPARCWSDVLFGERCTEPGTVEQPSKPNAIPVDGPPIVLCEHHDTRRRTEAIRTAMSRGPFGTTL